MEERSERKERKIKVENRKGEERRSYIKAVPAIEMR